MTKKKDQEKSKDLAKLLTPILLILLVGTAFMGGSLFTQLKSMEEKKEEKVAEEPKEVTPTVKPKEEQQPEKKVLGAEDLSEIEKSEIVRGNPDAPVTIVEFFEYQCPFCKRYIDGAYSQIWDEYGDKIRYVLHDYPLPFHQHAQVTAEAAHCADDQDDYWGYHDLLFEDRSWESAEDIDSALADFAEQLSLDVSKFSSCLSSGKHTQAVKDDFELGKKVGVGGTPSFFINGRLLVGAQPFEAFKKIIDEELNK